MIKYKKEFSRNYSLFQVVAYSDFVHRDITGLGITPYCGQPVIVHDGSPLVSIYYKEGDLAKIIDQLGDSKIFTEPFFDRIFKEFPIVTAKIEPYFRKEMRAGSVSELKSLYELLLDYYYGESIVWIMPLAEQLPKPLRELALIIREKTQHLSSLRDELFDYNLGKLFPSLGELTHFVLPADVFDGKSEEKLKREAEEYKKGFIYFDNRIYVGDKDGILKRLNIELEDTKSMKDVTSFVGQVASTGRVRGSVKIVLTNKDISKVCDGDILVSPMTRPDFLPAMHRSSAFVTDEGGITCHAAIVARELKKPCIIGTKIATQVLKDGDMVEVDADKGVVRIIKM